MTIYARKYCPLSNFLLNLASIFIVILMSLGHSHGQRAQKLKIHKKQPAMQPIVR